MLCICFFDMTKVYNVCRLKMRRKHVFLTGKIHEKQNVDSHQIFFSQFIHLCGNVEFRIKRSGGKYLTSSDLMALS